MVGQETVDFLEQFPSNSKPSNEPITSFEDWRLQATVVNRNVCQCQKCYTAMEHPIMQAILSIILLFVCLIARTHCLLT